MTADTISLVFSNLFLQLIVFFLPTQLGLHFWPDFSRVMGIKVDYLSPTIYFTDLLLIFYIFTNITSLFRWTNKHLRSILLYLVFVFLNTLIAISPLNSLFWWFRFSIYLLFVFILRLNKITFREIRKTLLVSTTLIIIIELGQFLSQSSLGGISYWLGERSFSASSSGLARLSLLGLELVRPPSTFSHPNSLAGYLLVVYYLFWINGSRFWERLLFVFGLFLTFSKAAILTFFLVTLAQSHYLLLVCSFIAFSIIQLFLSAIPTTLQFISDRLFLLAPTKKIITSHALGLGLGNFIPSLANYLPGSFLLTAKLQPVHNLFLLFIAELGVPGLISLLYMVKKYAKKLQQPAFIGLLAIIAITGSFDHYWWTLPQNRLILLIAAAILL